MPQWKKIEHRVKPNHGWRCSPGHQICVIGRGLMQFECPNTWVAVPTDYSLKMHERQPPYDDIVLEVSANQLPPTRWEEVNLTFMLQESLLKFHEHFVPAEEVHRIRQTALEDYELVWAERRALEEDPKDKSQRWAIWRHAICHTNDVLGHITYGFWEEAHKKADQVWEHFLKTIIMDRYIEDPTVGPKFH